MCEKCKHRFSNIKGVLFNFVDIDSISPAMRIQFTYKKRRVYICNLRRKNE